MGGCCCYQGGPRNLSFVTGAELTVHEWEQVLHLKTSPNFWNHLSRPRWLGRRRQSHTSCLGHVTHCCASWAVPFPCRSLLRKSPTLCGDAGASRDTDAYRRVLSRFRKRAGIVKTPARRRPIVRQRSPDSTPRMNSVSHSRQRTHFHN